MLSTVFKVLGTNKSHAQSRAGPPQQRKWDDRECWSCPSGAQWRSPELGVLLAAGNMLILFQAPMSIRRKKLKWSFRTLDWKKILTGPYLSITVWGLHTSLSNCSRRGAEQGRKLLLTALVFFCVNFLRSLQTSLSFVVSNRQDFDTWEEGKSNSHWLHYSPQRNICGRDVRRRKSRGTCLLTFAGRRCQWRLHALLPRELLSAAMLVTADGCSLGCTGTTSLGHRAEKWGLL